MPQAETLQLTPLDMAVAEKIGRQRDDYAAARRYSSRHPEAGKRTSSLSNHVLGAQAELAIARVLRLPWRSNVGTIEGVDVGRDVEVRCRRLRTPDDAVRGRDGIARGLLSLGPRDHEKGDKAFVLVHAYEDAPKDELSVIGWRLGLEVMQEKYWETDRDMAEGVFRVPHSELRSVSQLIEFLDFRREQRYDERLAAYLE